MTETSLLYKGVVVTIYNNTFTRIEGFYEEETNDSEGHRLCVWPIDPQVNEYIYIPIKDIWFLSVHLGNSHRKEDS